MTRRNAFEAIVIKKYKDITYKAWAYCFEKVFKIFPHEFRP